MARRVYDKKLGRCVVKHTRNMASQQSARTRLLKSRGSVCGKCGAEGYVELHHIVAAADGGTFDNDNLILLCGACHKLEHKPRG